MSKKAKINVDMVDPLSQQIKEMETKIQEQIGPYAHLPKVLLVGVTGAGKSSLSNSLADKPLLIQEGRGRKIILTGDGVLSGGTACTRQPTITVDSHNRFILCDCPGFKDTAGPQQEIINSFIIDYLFKCDQNTENKFKVLLVASKDEIYATRGQIITETLDRISDMLSCNRNLEKGVGFVISKAEKGISVNDYVEQLKDNPPEGLEYWANYWGRNMDRLFLFPSPTRNEINQNYTFDDHDRLIDFLTHNYLINPKHRITLGDSATREMENIQLKHSNQVKDIIYDMFKQITLLYQNEDSSDSFEHWFNVMNKMLNEKIDNTTDLKKFINENISSSGEFDKYFKTLESYENFDAFINKALESDILTTYIEESIQYCLRDIVRELTTMIRTCKVIEEQRSSISKQEQIITTQQQQNDELQKSLKEQSEANKKANDANQALQDQIKKMERRIEEKDRDLQMARTQQPSNNSSAFSNILAGFFSGLLTANKIPFFNFAASSAGNAEAAAKSLPAPSSK